MARRRFRPPVERTRDGFRLRLGDVERDLVARLLREYRSVLLGPADHPALRRLFPPAYTSPDHAEQEAEYQRLMREELVASRLTGIDTVLAALGSGPDVDDGSGAGPGRSGPRSDTDSMDEAQMLAFVQALNGVRLALAVLLGIDDDSDTDDADADDADDDRDADDPDRQLYGYLSYLLEWSMEALSGG